MAGHVKTPDYHYANCYPGSSVCAKAVLSEVHIVPRLRAGEQKASIGQNAASEYKTQQTCEFTCDDAQPRDSCAIFKSLLL